MSPKLFPVNEYRRGLKEFDDGIMLLLDNPDKEEARRSIRDITEARQTFMELFSSKVECEYEKICVDYGLCGNCKKNECKMVRSYFEESVVDYRKRRIQETVDDWTPGRLES